MFVLDSPSNDPRFNMAAEEYLLKETDREYAFFYINDPSIIIGKHQNAWAEINLPWTRENNIPVIRRISGGGAVWHDPGNLNFSFIMNGEEGKLVNFREYAAPVLEFLQGLGIPAGFGQRNELLAGGLKISGNAEHIHRNRVLHHGTLLFCSDLTLLRKALNTDPDLYRDKAVKSVPSRVGNIGDFLQKPMTMADFRRQLIGHLMFLFKGSEIVPLSEDATNRIQELVRDKYSLWEWNVGYSPRYQLRREWKMGRVHLRAELQVERGKITDCRLSVLEQYLHPGNWTEEEPEAEAKDYGILGDIFPEHAADLDTLARGLVGESHDPDALRTAISERNLVNSGWTDTFVKGLF